MSPTKRVLLVDDEAMVLRLMERRLRDDGFAVDTAENGVEGVIRLIDGDYDFVLLDIAMPLLSGTDALQIMKRVKPDVPVVTFTGHVGQGEMAETVRLGAIACLAKPFNFVELQRIMEQAQLLPAQA